MKKELKLLSPVTINRIAAGEVVERPASAIKELVENSLDANASKIDITICNSGRNLIIISDNGHGMDQAELELAVERHTTSKLDEDDILAIESFGFRGEALPSIASISRMKITSKTSESDCAWSIDVLGGEKHPVIPASLNQGTRIEIRDLFFATPARLKFLKSEKSEAQYIIDIINKLAIAHHNVAFSLTIADKIVINTKSIGDKGSRIAEILGENFISNAVEIDHIDGDIKVRGFASIPTFNRGSSSEQYLYVNNRPVKDKLLLTAVKIAYLDYLARDRHPYVVIFIELPFREVDVNVHPAKSEVRFRDSNRIKNIIISSLKSGIIKSAQSTSSEISQKVIESLVAESFSPARDPIVRPAINFDYSQYKQTKLHDSAHIIRDANLRNSDFSSPINEERQIISTPISSPSVTQESLRLGIAKCQLHQTYIVAQSNDSIIIVDQHAAHERLVYEKLKKSFYAKNIAKQRLLIPEIIELDLKRSTKLLEQKESLALLGVTIDSCGGNSVIITEIPALLSNCNIVSLINDISDDLVEYEENITLSQISDQILGTFACHNSVRSGRNLNIEEMDCLLREMEQTPFSGQCNHGRPTYVELKLSDIAKLFGRT